MEISKARFNEQKIASEEISYIEPTAEVVKENKVLIYKFSAACLCLSYI
jgi:hypothetical protein